jgi:hypothetical protein
MTHADDPDWIDFFAVNDVGVPAAVLSVLGVVTINKEGIKHVDDSFDAFCDALGVDKHGEYDSLYNILQIANG